MNGHVFLRRICLSDDISLIRYDCGILSLKSVGLCVSVEHVCGFLYTQYIMGKMRLYV